MDDKINDTVDIDSLNLSSEELQHLDIEKKDRYMEVLQNLIHQTTVIEQSYKELEFSFRNLENLNIQILESLPVALWVIEKDGEIFLQNEEAKKLQSILEKLDTQERTAELEHEGSFYLIQINKKPEKTIISATDITEEKRKERLASMGQVAAHLAHEIRNPIGSVALLTSSLLKKVDVKTKPIVFEIKKSIWRVERIVKATLLFSKGLQPNMESFKISALKDEMGLAIQHYTYSKEIGFVFDFPESFIYADHDLLAIVFQNFIFNAIDAIEDEDEVEEGKIECIYLKKENHHLFKIYDNGRPIENEKMLFEPFKTTKTKGHGLGLALSMQVMAAHGGEIFLLQEERKGFGIRLPLGGE